MNKSSKADYYFFGALISAIWFTLTSFFWVYYTNVFISFPFGLLSLFLWNKGKKLEQNSMRFMLVLGVLITGVLLSIISLFMYLYKN